MKVISCTIAVLMSVCLFSACTFASRGGQNTPASERQPSQPDVRAEEAKAEAPQQRTGTLFSGTIGQARFEMDLKREGGTLNGTYYYLKSGSSNRLTLKGKIAGDGTFTMQESDAAGKQTGEFRGKWKNEPNESGASLEGEWLKPGQKDGGMGFWAWEQMVYFASTQATPREMKESVKAKKAELSAQYPELSGGPNVAGFNQLVKAKITRDFAEFKKMLAELTAADIKQMGEMGNYIDVGYNIEYADDDLISVSFGEDTFTGGAHPNHDTSTITYDLKQGRELKLADLFKPGSKYLATVADFAMRDLKGRKDPDSGENIGLAQDMWEDGAKPTAENYRNWNITKKGLLVTFPPYQVGAYAFGTQTVIVPYSQLKDLIKADGALAKFST